MKELLDSVPYPESNTRKVWDKRRKCFKEKKSFDDYKR